MRYLRYLAICVVVSSGCMGEADTDTEATVHNIGLAQEVMSVVPPSGEGLAPIAGSPGDGAAVVTGIGLWSSGPGGIRWHGGQWVIPVSAQPGSMLANMFCDVVPGPSATDKIELVGASGVIGSMTVPATTMNMVIRGWIVPAGGYTVQDGEHLVIRHSPRDSVTGMWTSAVQDLTIIGCAVNSVPRTLTAPIVITAASGHPVSGSDAILSVTGDRFVATRAGDVVAFPIELPVGTRIRFVDIWYQRSGGTPFFALMKQVLSTGASSMISSTADGTTTTITMRTIGTINYDTLPTEQYWFAWTAGAPGDDIRSIILH